MTRDIEQEVRHKAVALEAFDALFGRQTQSLPRE